MRSLLLAAAAAGLALLARADCPNACSGQGMCSTSHDFCICNDGFMGNDCSQRICPFAIGWADTQEGDWNYDNVFTAGGRADNKVGANVASNGLNPNFHAKGWYEAHPSQLLGLATDSGLDTNLKLQEGHYYKECAGRGMCARDTGICTCFDGWEGIACNRTACPNQCSGHGVCQSIRDSDPAKTYQLWDAEISRGCECDGGYTGNDCSKRVCERNDDPLTDTTTRTGVNALLTEQDGIQQAIVGCPYNGVPLNPVIALRYTDGLTGDVYDTLRFNVATADKAAITAALQALPNKALADNVGISTIQRVWVNADPAAVGNTWTFAVTFHESMGTVPLLEVVPYYKCKGGAEVAGGSYATGPDYENFFFKYNGQGPSQNLHISATWNAAGTAWDLAAITNANGDVLEAAQTGVTVNNAAWNTFGVSADVAAVEVWPSGAVTAADRNVEVVTFTIHVEPKVSVNYKRFAFKAGAQVAATGTGSVKITMTQDATPVADYHLTATAVTAALVHSVVVDGEFIEYCTFTTTATLVDDTTACVANAPPAGNERISAALGDVKLATVAGLADADSSEFYAPKDVVANQYDDSDVISLTYLNGQAVDNTLTVVVRITKTSTSTDEYRWMLSGNPLSSWSAAVAIPAAATPTALSGSPTGDVSLLLFSWADGPDLQTRVEGEYYYFQIGQAGTNDAPECSGRGICDETAGECVCFRGYTGPACKDQHALAGGQAVLSA